MKCDSLSLLVKKHRVLFVSISDPAANLLLNLSNQKKNYAFVGCVASECGAED